MPQKQQQLQKPTWNLIISNNYEDISTKYCQHCNELVFGIVKRLSEIKCAYIDKKYLTQVYLICYPIRFIVVID